MSVRYDAINIFKFVIENCNINIIHWEFNAIINEAMNHIRIKEYLLKKSIITQKELTELSKTPNDFHCTDCILMSI